MKAVNSPRIDNSEIDSRRYVDKFNAKYVGFRPIFSYKMK